MEIDLIRGGHAARDQRPAQWPQAECQIVVNRAYSFATVRCTQQTCVTLCLPSRVPLRLRQKEPDAALDLQPLVNQCYAKGRYWMLPYDRDPQPPREGENMSWAQNIAVDAGLRPEP